MVCQPPHFWRVVFSPVKALLADARGCAPRDDLSRVRCKKQRQALLSKSVGVNPYTYRGLFFSLKIALQVLYNLLV